VLLISSSSKTNSYYPNQSNPSASQSMATQMHVIEFKVGNDSYQLQGEGSVVKNMVKNMRRSRLVTV